MQRILYLINPSFLFSLNNVMTISKYSILFCSSFIYGMLLSYVNNEFRTLDHGLIYYEKVHTLNNNKMACIQWFFLCSLKKCS